MRNAVNLNLMRSVAVLLVVLAHLDLYSGWSLAPLNQVWLLGTLGVAIFFTHTTLVLMWSLDRDPHTLRFYIRRAFRIYPLWLVVLVFSIAVQLPTSPAFAPQFRFLHVGFREFLYNAFLVFNIWGGARLIGASWSLPVEMQMYIVLPLLFFFMKHNRALWPLILLEALAIVTAKSVDPPLAGDLLFYTPCFLPGAIAYMGFKKFTPRLPAWLFPIWLLSLVESFNVHASHKQSSLRSIWLFALILGMSLPLFKQINWRPLALTVHMIARYSYGIYLCHFAAIAVALHYLRADGLVTRIVAFVAVLVGLSVLFYHTVEEPMIRLGSKIAKRFVRGPEARIDERELSLEMAP